MNLKPYFQTSKRGSALLVALVFTGLLILVTIGVSSLITRESNQLITIVDGSRAYYAAESGIELGLLDVQENNPGFAKKTSQISLSESYSAVLEYRIQSLTNRIPFLEDFEIQALRDGNVRFAPEQSYQRMPLNDSITIALAPEIRDFRVDYYWPLGPQLQQSNLNDYDIIRWKLFGTSKTTGSIDSISEFMPASFLNDSSRGVAPQRPACLGLDGGQCWNAGTFYPSALTDVAADFDAGSTVTIRDFMETHTDMYLILSNFLDPAKINSGGLAISEEQGADIFYRVWDLAAQDDSSGSGSLITPFTQLKAEGNSNESSRILEVQIAPNNFLPIFDFALYRPKL